VNKINIRNISLALSYITISAYIVLGSCLTFNLGNRAPIKVAEIIAFISCVILLILHKKDAIKVGKNNIKIIGWFIIALIPMFLYKYNMKQIVYGALYPARAIATLAVAIVITNVFKKYEITGEKICKYFINNYLVVGVIGILQLIFYPEAYDFYDLFYNIGVYFTNPDPHTGRLLSTYFDPNFLAACMIIPTILALDLFSKTNKRKYLLEVIFFITIIVLTVSRSGVAGVCLALFIYAICTIKKENKKIKIGGIQKRAFGVMIATAVVFVLLTAFTNVRVFKRIIGSLEDESTYARVSDWSKGLKIMDKTDEPTEESNDPVIKNDEINPLFGIGYNMIGFTEQNADKGAATSFGNDSSLLLIYISSGIIGVIYFAYLVLSRLIKGYKERNKYMFNTAMITIILTSLVVCNFNNLLFYTLWIFPIFVLLNINKDEIEEVDRLKINKKNKIIGIDARGLNGNKAGIPTYVEKIIEQINNSSDKNNKYILYSNKKVELDFEPNDNIEIKVKENSMIGTIWLYFMLPKMLREDNVDIFWGTQHVLPERNEDTKNIKYVVTIYDLAIQKLKTVGSRGNTLIQKVFVKRSLEDADAIITISEATKKDIMEIFKIGQDKIKVTYCGTNIEKQKELTEEEKKEMEKKFKTEDTPFIFFLSTIEPRKNIETLIKAFDYIREKEDVKLILAGKLGWKYDEILKSYENSKHKEDIIMPGFISKEEKNYLYKNAKCFVYPSLYEGFGLPILEAMANEVLVVTANNSSLPEVGGDAVSYYNNVLDYEELANKILETMKLSEEERQERIEKGLEQAKKFTWEKCAKETLEVLN